MKNKIRNSILLAGMLALNPLPVLAEETSGTVIFTKDEKMNYSDLNQKIYLDEIANMQPGDTTTISMDMANQYAKATNWYMNNSIIKSLQEADNEKTLGGGYEYRLTYVDPDGQTRTLYESTALGGKDQEGLLEANDGLNDYFYLGNLAPGEKGKVNLEIALDGETQGNDYQRTMAEVAMQFATEIADPGTVKEEDKVVHKTEKKRIVNTSTLTNRLPWLLLSAASGLVLLILAILGLKERKKEGA